MRLPGKIRYLKYAEMCCLHSNDYVELHAHGNAPQIGHIAYSATVSILYCDVIFSKPPDSVIERLRVAFNSCARYISGISRYEHITQYANRILGIPLEQFYSFRMCCTMNNVIKTGCPRYLFSEIHFGQSSRMFNIIILFHRSNRMLYIDLHSGFNLVEWPST
jgi:hypothetical protein